MFVNLVDNYDNLALRLESVVNKRTYLKAVEYENSNSE